MPGPSLGTNLSALVDWSTAFPFVNQFLLTREWYTQRDGVFDTGEAHLLDLDDRGWVRGFTADGSAPPFDSVATMFNTSGTGTRPGTYVLDWQGSGEIEITGGQNLRILSQEDGRITLRLDGPGQFQIAITSTDPDGTGDYLRDLRLYHAQDADLIDAGELFAPEFLARIEGFRALRFMDWMATNNSRVQDRADVTEFDAARQTSPNGASVELMVALANQTRADPWFTIPHLASNAWIRDFVTYVRDNLDEGLVARFEYSNEVWNWGFDQAHWAHERAQAVWGEDAEAGWMQWYGVRAANMARIVADVFGDETGTRALNVFSTQAGWHGLESYALDASEHVALGGAAPRTAPFHVYAIAPYFGGSVGSTEQAERVDRWIAMGDEGLDRAIRYIRNGASGDSLANIGDTIAYHAAVANSLGWQLEAYEGGQHVVDLDGLFGGNQDPAQTQFFIDLVRHPGFYDLYIEYFEIWRENGGGLMAQFSDFVEPSRYGSWGIWDSLWSGETPRSQAVQDFRDQVAAWWDDPRGGDTFDNGRLLADHDRTGLLQGGDLADAIYGLDGADVLRGHGGNDRIHGGAGHDTAAGGAGDDWVSGAAGHDLLQGYGGRDTLIGGSGNDTLVGGAGNDRLEGGPGADVFAFAPGFGRDTITDFNPDQDVILLTLALTGGLTGGLAVLRAHAEQAGDDVILRLPGGERLTIEDAEIGRDLARALLIE